MSRVKETSETLALGPTASAHLLPPEVEEKQKGQALRRMMFIALAGVAALIILGVGVATVGVVASDSALRAEQGRTTGLTAQQGKYGKVVTVRAQVTEIQAAQVLGTVGEIDWQSYIAQLQGTLPAGTTITSFHALLRDPSQGAGGSTVPLQGPYVATLSMSADSPKASVSDWLDALSTMKGFVDATPGNVALNVATGRYTVEVDMHISTAALQNRYAGKK
ncbi:MAG: hypothetical protein JWN09_1982 [Microbacteriaceae bacterium]|jgi:hypothetical protein|nr:hypothetical protein [Microbacteriaceae bacterium]